MRPCRRESLRSRRCPTPTSPRRRWPASRKPKGGVALTIVLALVSIFWIAPLALLVITAVRPLSDFVANGALSWPQEFTWTNFTDAWGSATSPPPTATARFC